MDTTLELNLKHIAQIKSQLSEIEKRAKPLEDELEQLKLEVLDQMKAQHSKRTEAVGGWYVIRSERSNVIVTDQSATKKYLADNQFDLDEYLKLDAARIKGLAESTLKETGEIVPGIEFRATEYLTLKAEGK